MESIFSGALPSGWKRMGARGGISAASRADSQIGSPSMRTQVSPSSEKRAIALVVEVAKSALKEPPRPCDEASVVQSSSAAAIPPATGKGDEVTKAHLPAMLTSGTRFW